MTKELPELIYIDSDQKSNLYHLKDKADRVKYIQAEEPKNCQLEKTSKSILKTFYIYKYRDEIYLDYDDSDKTSTLIDSFSIKYTEGIGVEIVK